MKLKTLMIINAVVAGVFGIVEVLAPSAFYSFYGVTSNVDLDLMARLLGSAFITFAVLLWKAKDIDAPETQSAIKWAFFTGHSIAFIVSLLVQLRYSTHSLGWSTVAIYFLLALGFGYFLFIKPIAGKSGNALPTS